MFAVIKAGGKQYRVIEDQVAAANDAGGTTGALTAAGLIIGTPEYLAPERMLGQPATAQSDVYSVGVHTRRSRTIYRLALGGDVEVGALAARPVDYDDERWWASSTGAKKTLNEVVSLAWTACCFWPEPPAAPSLR